MKRISQILSAVFSPLFVPTYAVVLALWLSLLAFSPVTVRIHVALLTLCITCLVPAVGIFCLYKARLISSPSLNERGERTLPFVITALAYGACACYLARSNAPEWLWMFMVGGVAATVVSAIVNRWWKISAHMAAMGGLVAMALRMIQLGVAAPGVDMTVWLMVIIIAAGCVGTARVYLGRHTLLQVAAGAANGFLCVYLLN